MPQRRTAPPRSLPGRARRVHGALVWNLARQAFADGVDPGDICGRYGLNRSTLRDRVRREGWRRADIDDPQPWTLMDEHRLRRSRFDMMEAAWSNAARAVTRKRRLEARSWLAVVRDLGGTFDVIDRVYDPNPADSAEPAPGPGGPGTLAVTCDPVKTEACAPLTAESAQSAPITQPPFPEASSNPPETSDAQVEPHDGLAPELVPVPTAPVLLEAPPGPAPRPDPLPLVGTDPPGSCSWSCAGDWRYTDAYIAALRRKPHPQRTDRENRIVARANGADTRVLP